MNRIVRLTHTPRYDYSLCFVNVSTIFGGMFLRLFTSRPQPNERTQQQQQKITI